MSCVPPTPSNLTPPLVLSAGAPPTRTGQPRHTALTTRLLNLVAVALAVAMSVTTGGFLAGCDEDDEEYYVIEPTGRTSVVFYNECLDEPEIDIFLDGRYVCTESSLNDLGCRLDLEPGHHVYWAEGLSLTWGEPRTPIAFYASVGELEVIRLTCP